MASPLSITSQHSASPPVQQRSVVLVTPDADLRQRLAERLTSMRWNVLSASGGAEAMVHLGGIAPEAMIVDHWLPDLDAAEFAEHVAALCPATDLLAIDGSAASSNLSRSPRRNELLHALREAQESMPVPSPIYTETTENYTETPKESAPSREMRSSASAQFDGPAWLSAPVVIPSPISVPPPGLISSPGLMPSSASLRYAVLEEEDQQSGATVSAPVEVRMHLPEMVGDSASIREMARLVRMVAPHTANVLILGETGSGKELVAKAVHRLSHRAGKPFVVLNCAAIPEHLLEAELFGHTRGAFTGAVSSRTGRIEAAHGGTLFLDEIGEMPLPLQAKMLRFLENGEIQKVGENDSVRVDVRILAATHQPLEQNAGEKLFRLDLYHRLAVFPVDVPALRDRREDIPMLAEHFLRRFGEQAPRRAITQEALRALAGYSWPGNVRELSHTLQRASILCGDEAAIRTEHLRLRTRPAANLSPG